MKLYQIVKPIVVVLLGFILFNPLSLNAHNKNHNSSTVLIKLLGINDFHGQISTGKYINNEPVGGAAVLAAYLKQAQKGMENRTIITIMGDLVGASPPSSGLLHDEPTILFINSLGNEFCSSHDRMNMQCNIVATVGNHEFDKGQQSLKELIYGTDLPPTDSWISLPHYPGASYPYISANIVNTSTNQPLFPPYVIKLVQGIRVGFIGAILKNADKTMFPQNAEGLTFLDEAATINQYIPELKAKGADIIVVLLHEGGKQQPYEGPTIPHSKVDGAIQSIVHQLNDDIDVVMCGHTHQFLNAYIPNHHGVDILVTQANSYSASFAEVDLEFDTMTHYIKNKYARIITTYANRWPGSIPDESTQQLVKLAEDQVEPTVNSYLATLETPLLRQQNRDGESNLGNLVADAFRDVMEAEIGLTNLHGLRDDLRPGLITWGNLFAVLPFSNEVVTITLTGDEIYDLLEQQWVNNESNMLQISGISYEYNTNNPIGRKILTVRHHNQPLIRDKRYTIATTNFLASGSGNFSVMKKSHLIKTGASDHETVSQYLKKIPQPIQIGIEGRIKQMN